MSSSGSVCQRCAQDGADLRCQICKLSYHRQCNPSRLLRGGEASFVCGDCERDQEEVASGPMSMIILPSESRPSSRTDDREQTEAICVGESALVRSLRERIIELEQLALAADTAVKGDITSNANENYRQRENLHVDMGRNRARSTLLAPPTRIWRTDECANNTAEERATASFSATRDNATAVNKSQLAILESIAQRPLSQNEICNRKLEADMPEFDGNPAKYFLFASTYRQSTARCGYSQADNLKRLDKCLRGSARALVQHLLPYPQHVDKILERLEKNFGQPETLLANMTVKINAAASLKDNLSNIQEFFALVEDAKTVVELMDGPVQDVTLVKKLVTKLPDSIWREWNKFQRGQRCTVTLFGSFVLELCDEAMAMKLQKEEMNPVPEKKQKLSAKERVLLTENPQEKPTHKRTRKAATTPGKCSFGCDESHCWDKCPVFLAMNTTQRLEIATKEKRCFFCLNWKHRASKCFKKAPCKFTGCEKLHHELLHNKQEPAKQPELVAMSNVEQRATYFRTVSVIVSANGVAVRTTALMDSGSSVTLMRTDLAKRLKLEGEPVNLPLTWANGETKPIQSRKVGFNIYGRDLAVFQISAQTMDELRLPVSELDENVVVKEFKGIVPVESEPPAPAEILIGLDNAKLTRTYESRVGTSGQLIASRTPLGWVFEGKVANGQDRCLFVERSTEEESLERMVAEYIEADNFGLIPDDQVICQTHHDARAMSIMESTTVLQNGRFTTGLLWRSDTEVLPDNREMAYNRQTTFERKLQKDSVLWRKVDDLIKSYLDKGYVRALVHRQVKSDREWYLPIFTVRNANKPDKIRIVWDAAAGVNGRSLNSALLTGPDLTAPLVQVLQRFRYGQFSLSGDIEEMFHQVVIREADRCAQRFLWRGPDDKQVGEYEMQVMLFGTTCSPTIAQYVKNRNAERFRESYPDAVNAIVNDHYVDDFLQSCDTEEQAVRLAKEVTAIHKAGGFKIHKWISNSRIILDALGAPRAEEETKVSYCEPMVLGLEYSTINDTFRFKFRGAKIAQMITRIDQTTKRELLRVASSLFDPLGLVAYITVLPRLLLREVWRARIDWDEAIPQSTCGRLEDWVRYLKRLEQVNIPRWHGTSGREVSLHVFCDASDSALAAAAYVVQRHGGGPTTRSLCIAKCKVAPLKQKSIPRLELDAAVLGVRVLDIVMASSCWRFDKLVFWTDARDVLFWIRGGERRYGQYVANRVAAILTKTSVEQWRWVPSAHNPADYATKWNASRKDDRLWWRGPEFLDEDESQWPDSFEPPTTIQELRHIMSVRQEFTHPLVPPVERFSSWMRFVRNVATALLFIDVLQKRRAPGPATTVELYTGEALIYREMQKRMTESELAKFSAFMDENGIYRMRGRTARATHLPYNARFPVILPSGHTATELIVKHFHSFGGHSNHQRTLNELRQHYVLAKPKGVLNKVIRDCAMCTVRRTRPICPEMAALPACRLGFGYRPFTFTGVDLFGPYEVAVGRRREKRWGTLFTCLTTRAIYLELVPSLSAKSCIVAIDSLAARRGVPAEIRSDNGTNFIAAAKIYRGPDGRRPCWRFNPPMASHFGGAWERMIGIVKRALSQMELERTPSEERLRHLLLKAEAIVNSRPLTEVPVEHDEDEALTPNHFLLGNSTGARERVKLPEDTSEKLTDVKQEMDQELASFWKRWTRGYLPLISKRSKWREQCRNLEVDDLVFICDGDYRAGWRRGRIIEVFIDKESGQTRQVVVETANGTRYRRAAHQIAPIVRKTAA